jgi:hypothetical protein
VNQRLDQIGLDPTPKNAGLPGGQDLMSVVLSLVSIQLLLESGPVLNPILRIMEPALGQRLIHRLRYRDRPIGGPVLSDVQERRADRLFDLVPLQFSRVLLGLGSQFVKQTDVRRCSGATPKLLQRRCKSSRFRAGQIGQGRTLTSATLAHAFERNAPALQMPDLT